MAIRVMHILGSWGAGGAETGVLRLINYLPKEIFAHSLCIFGDRTDGPSVPNGINLYTVPKRFSGWPAPIGLCNILKKSQTNIAHVNNLSPWFDAALGARLAGCKCLLTFHGIESSSLEFSFFRRLLMRVSLSLSASVTAVADSAAELLKKLLKMDSLALKVIANGVDTDLYKPCVSENDKLSIRKSLGLPEKPLLLGCVAAFRPVKNHEGLLKAFRSALRCGSPESARNVLLVLVGDGPLKDKMHSLAQQLQINENVIFLGNRNDVPQILRALDAFALNSTTEGLSYAILEAMATALPVIATSVGANPTLIAHGRRGLLVRHNDESSMAGALAFAINNRPLLHQMGSAARHKIVSCYSIQAMTTTYGELYEQLMNPKGARTYSH